MKGSLTLSRSGLNFRRLVRSLAISLSPSEMERLQGDRRRCAGVPVLHAWDLFLEHANQGSLENAVKFFNLAVERDPITQTRTRPGGSYNMQNEYGYENGEHLHQKALSAAVKAIDLDPSVAKAYVALAYIQIIIEKTYRGTAIFGKAIELAPFDSTARLRYAWSCFLPGSLTTPCARCGWLRSTIRFRRRTTRPLRNAHPETKLRRSSCYADRASSINRNTPTIAFYRANALFFKRCIRTRSANSRRHRREPAKLR